MGIINALKNLIKKKSERSPEITEKPSIGEASDLAKREKSERSNKIMLDEPEEQGRGHEKPAFFGKSERSVGILELKEAKKAEDGSKRVKTGFKQEEKENLLAIYEKIAKIEEILRIIDDRLVILDAKVATKDEMRDIRQILAETNQNKADLSEKLSLINQKIDILAAKREELSKLESESKHLAESFNKEAKKVEKTLKILESHRKILEALRNGEKSTIDLANELGFTRQYVWERLQELKSAGFVDQKKKGRKTVYFLINESVN